MAFCYYSNHMESRYFDLATSLSGIWWNGRRAATHRREIGRTRGQPTKVCVQMLVRLLRKNWKENVHHGLVYKMIATRQVQCDVHCGNVRNTFLFTQLRQWMYCMYVEYQCVIKRHGIYMYSIHRHIPSALPSLPLYQNESSCKLSIKNRLDLQENEVI